MAASANGGIPLVDTKKVNHGKEHFVEGKGDGGFKVQGQWPIKSTESNQGLMKKTQGNASCLTVQVEETNVSQRGDLSPELETSSPNSAHSGPLSAQPKKVFPASDATGLSTLPNPSLLGNPTPPKKIVLPIPADLGPLAAQPSAPPPAVVSQDLPQLNPCPGLHRVLLPVAPLVSPSHFALRLLEREEELCRLVESMTANPPVLVPGWTIGKNQTLALLHKNQWFRGVAVRKTGDQFSVYRVDIGDIVTVPKNSLRPLPAPLCKQPPGCLQCCLAGADPKEGDVWSLDSVQVFSELVNGEGHLCYPIVVEVLGKVKGGRLAVRLQGQEDGVDVSELMIETGFAKKQTQNCMFGLEAEVEPGLLGGVKMVKLDAKPTEGMCEVAESGNKGKLGDQDVNANVKSSVEEVAITKEVVVKKTGEESMGPVDQKKLVMVKPNVEAEKTKEKRFPEEKKPDSAQKSSVSADKSKHCGVKNCDSKDPVASKGHVGNQAEKKNLEEGGRLGSPMPAKPQVENRLAGEKAEKSLRTAEGCKKYEIKENKVDPKSSPGDQKPHEEGKCVEDTGHISKQKAVKEERTVVDKGAGQAGHCKENKKSEVKKLCRGEFKSDCKQFGAEVCHFDSLESFFLCSKEQQDKFLTLMLKIQEPQESLEAIDVLREVGTACRAFYDGMFYRAEITAVDSEKDMVTVFLVDHGAKIIQEGSKLRHLDPSHLEEPGCVVDAALAGVQPIGETWSKEENEMAGLVLSPEVPLEVNIVGEKDGKVLVNLTDMEGNNLADLLVEAGVVAPKDIVKKDPATESAEAGADSTSLAPPALTYGKLESGSMMVFAAASPLDLHLSTGALFEQYSDIVYPAVEDAGVKGTVQKEVTVGSRVLAHDEDCWYRALVSTIMPDGQKAEVFLLDLAASLTVDINSLKVASPDLFEFPIMAVPVCLSGWEGEDKEKAAEEWGEKMKVLVPELFAEVEVEVVEQDSNGRWKVKVPAWEKTLIRKPIGNAAENPKGKAASLLMKMKSSSIAQ